MACALPVPVVANLPFNVGTALLVKWLTVAEWPPWWSSLTLMFQKEVAKRIMREARDAKTTGGCRCWRNGGPSPRILFDMSDRARSCRRRR